MRLHGNARFGDGKISQKTYAMKKKRIWSRLRKRPFRRRRSCFLRFNPIPNVPKASIESFILSSQHVLCFSPLSVCLLSWSASCLSLCNRDTWVIYLRDVSANSGLSVPALLHTISQSQNEMLPMTDGRMNVLVLGTDALANRDEESKLTDDHHLIVSVKPEKGIVTTFSIPKEICGSHHSPQRLMVSLRQRNERHNKCRQWYYWSPNPQSRRHWYCDGREDHRRFWRIGYRCATFICRLSISS